MRAVALASDSGEQSSVSAGESRAARLNWLRCAGADGPASDQPQLPVWPHRPLVFSRQRVRRFATLPRSRLPSLDVLWSSSYGWQPSPMGGC